MESGREKEEDIDDVDGDGMDELNRRGGNVIGVSEGWFREIKRFAETVIEIEIEIDDVDVWTGHDAKLRLGSIFFSSLIGPESLLMMETT